MIPATVRPELAGAVMATSLADAALGVLAGRRHAGGGSDGECCPPQPRARRRHTTPAGTEWG